jgi:hypothetical protein
MPRSHRRGSSRLGIVAAAVFLAGCGSGGPPASAPAGSPAASAPESSASPGATEATVSATLVPSATLRASATATVDPAAFTTPPDALLAGAAATGGPAAGQLGTFTWGDEGSDAPWIVPSAGTVVEAGTAVDIAFEPPVAPESWTARWAPVADGAPGDVAAATDGTGPASVTTPGDTGTWSLQVEARFGEGHSAVWYWRIEVR